MGSLHILLILLLCFAKSFAQLTGNYPISGSAYPTLASEITALNSQGVGAVRATFNVPTGYSETFTSPTAGYINSNTGSATNPIVMEKSVYYQGRSCKGILHKRNAGQQYNYHG
jgi:hypothetical protein